MQNLRAQAAPARRIKGHLPEPLLRALGDNLLRLRIELAVLLRVLDEKCIEVHIGGLIQQAADGVLAVAPRAARLLIVALQVLGHVVVHDEGHVRLVDAHAERVGRHDHRQAVGDEILLRVLPLLIAHARVVAHGVHAVFHEHPRDLLHAPARAAVDDAALPAVLLQKAKERRVPVALPANLEVEIRPIKARRHDIGTGKLQQAHDVPAHALCRRRGERAHARAAGQARDERCDVQIAGPEVLSPLADAVCLVDDDLRNRRVHGKIQKTLGQKALRRDIDDPVHAAPGVVKRQRILPARQ